MDVVTIEVTVVGNDIFSRVEELAQTSLGAVNQVNPGRLGNFMTLTIFCEIPENEVIARRRKFMDLISLEGSELVGLYEHGNWMKVHIFKKSAWKSRDDHAPR